MRRGARGLKIFKSFGLTVRDREGKVVPVDDGHTLRFQVGFAPFNPDGTPQRGGGRRRRGRIW